MQLANPPNPDLIPAHRYRAPNDAIRFLQAAFGFEPHLVVPDGSGGVAHAELISGCGIVMLGSERDDAWKFRVPRDIGGANTQGVYVATADIDALYAQAKRAGATIVRELSDTDYGSRDFSAVDPEGHRWGFGTYHPSAGVAEGAASPRRENEIFAGARYEDARAAIAFLVRAFGLREQFVVPGEGDAIAHAQLAFGSSIYMLGSVRDDESWMTTPRRLGGGYTQTVCGYVADPDAHFARAKEAGAEIIDAPADTDYGARGYSAYDSEGHVWTFSTYRPAAVEKAAV